MSRSSFTRVFDPIGPNVSTFASTPFAPHARPYRQNLRVIGKSLYRNLRFIPAFRPAAENEQMCNAVGLNASDGIPSPLHAMHFCHRHYCRSAIDMSFRRSGLFVPDFADADRLTPRCNGNVNKLRLFFADPNWVFSCPHLYDTCCLRACQETILRSFPRWRRIVGTASLRDPARVVGSAQCGVYFVGSGYGENPPGLGSVTCNFIFDPPAARLKTSGKSEAFCFESCGSLEHSARRDIECTNTKF
jgi:hypothetical protein